MTERERDYAFEALAEATNSDWNASRGELNISLKSIREQSELDGLELAAEIHERAKLYPDVIGGLLTPTALMKHWSRIRAEERRVESRSKTNQHVARDDCETCGGDRMVVVSVRKPAKTRWLVERGLPTHDVEIEELAPCPDCNPRCVTSFRRFDGWRVDVPDPAAVREMLRR